LAALEDGCQNYQNYPQNNAHQYLDWLWHIHAEEKAVGINAGNHGNAIGNVMGFDLPASYRTVNKPANKA
jgi:hypothetical protein